MNLANLIDLPVNGDTRGSLIAIESTATIPFEIKRVYYIFGTKKNVSRGFHAHKNIKQILICVSGKCRLLLDNGINRESIWLDSPQEGIIIEGMTWREMHDFSQDCVLLVLANDHYKESDYIRDYEDFKEIKARIAR